MVSKKIEYIGYVQSTEWGKAKKYWGEHRIAEIPCLHLGKHNKKYWADDALPKKIKITIEEI